MSPPLRYLYQVIGQIFDTNWREVERVGRFCRQEKLVPGGKPGPGGGPAESTPETIAYILLGLLATDSRRDAGIEASLVGMLAPRGRRTCRITGTRSLSAALTKILSNPALAEQAVVLSVTRAPGYGADLVFKNDRQDFVLLKNKDQAEEPVSRHMSIAGVQLLRLALELSDEGTSDGDDDNEWTAEA